MKILVYGAGVIGCYLTHALMAAGQDVTLLARGNWKETLERDGLVIHHSLQRKTTNDHPAVIDAVDPAQSYDVVFAVMQHQQLMGILPDLARIHAPLVISVGNNLSAPYMEQYLLEHSPQPKTILFGFQATGGRRENGRVECVRFGSAGMSLGSLHGETPEEIKTAVQRFFAGTKYSLTWLNEMDAWYRGHLAFILPVAYLCYAVGCDLRRSTRRQRKLILDAANEAFGLLKTLGYPVVPTGEDRYYQPGIKRMSVSAMLLLMAKTVLGDLAASDHCRHAVTEMQGLDAAWMEMRNQKPDFPMPAWDTLRREMPPWEALHTMYDR